MKWKFYGELVYTVESSLFIRTVHLYGRFGHLKSNGSCHVKGPDRCFLLLHGPVGVSPHHTISPSTNGRHSHSLSTIYRHVLSMPCGPAIRYKDATKPKGCISNADIMARYCYANSHVDVHSLLLTEKTENELKESIISRPRQAGFFENRK
jgi:hypothetical protein